MRGRMFVAAMSAVVSVALVFASGLSVLADTIQLTDGRQMHGTITEMGDESLTLQPSDAPDAPVTIAWSDVEYAALQSGDCIQQAGERLTSFRTKYFVGLGLSFVGSIVSFIGLLSANPPNPASATLSLLIGGMLSLAGTILTVFAFWEIGSAGDALQQCKK